MSMHKLADSMHRLGLILAQRTGIFSQHPHDTSNGVQLMQTRVAAMAKLGATLQKGDMALHNRTARRAYFSTIGWIALMVGLTLLLVSGPLLADTLLPSPAPGLLRTAALAKGQSQPRGGLFVNPQSRNAVIEFYNTYYVMPENLDPQWTGDAAACNAGATSEAFRAAVLRRINFFRAMAGVPADITFSDEYNRKAQAAALMMSANRALNHYPDSSWNCYSADGADAANSSNLHLVASPNAIDDYMRDDGDINSVVPHRRWLLYPQTRQMGTGDVFGQNGYPAANALWVIDEPHYFDERPATRDGFVAWPPPGYVPQDLIFDRWSISFGGADFSDATVSMTINGQTVPLTAAVDDSGYGEPTIVWQPDLSMMASVMAASPHESGVVVSINNMRVDGQVQTLGYEIATVPPDATPEPLDQIVYAPFVTK
jgi:hypothetical protein